MRAQRKTAKYIEAHLISRRISQKSLNRQPGGQEMDGFSAELRPRTRLSARQHLTFARACARAGESWFVRADESSFVSRDSAAVSHLIETDLVNNERLNPHHHASRLLFNGCRSFGWSASFFFVRSLVP